MALPLPDFFSWFAAQDDAWRRQPWLGLGKGPSFAKLGQFDTRPFLRFGLNHVITEARVDVAHAIDIEVVLACAPLLQAQSGALLMPWLPNVGSRPGRKTLQEWAGEVPALAALASQGRLLWYNRACSPAHGDSRVARRRRAPTA